MNLLKRLSRKDGPIMKRKKSLLAFLMIASLLQPATTWAAEVDLLDKYPVKTPLFTQGLELDPTGKELILGTGLEGKSQLGTFNLQSGELEDAQNLPNNYFGEGITFTPNALWQLTWKEKKVLKRDPKTFEILDEIDINTEGWGICYDPDEKVIWRSDGTSTLYKHDPETFELLGQVKIMNGKLAASKLNELEWANGHIYANRLYRDEILKIDLASESVVETYDVRPMLDQTLNEEEIASVDTLNGIAHIEGDEFYITGKLYPYIYKVRLK